MNWISVEDQLPKSRKRYLALCQNNDSENAWNGIVDVFFDPRIGWCRCESKDMKPIYVIFYTEHPNPDWPWTPIIKKDKEGK